MPVDLDEFYRDITKNLPRGLDVFGSQEGEDVLLRRLLKSKYHEDGIYVDVGAHHPIRFSTTVHYYMKGWRGINIEPNAEAFDQFAQLRPRDINLAVAVGNPCETKFYRFQEPAFNTFDEEQKEYALTKTELIETVVIEKYRLDEILFSNLKADDLEKLMFLNVDVEGGELEVLATSNWEVYRPLLVLVEALDAQAYLEIESFLQAKNYCFVARTKNTYFFAERDFKERYVD